MRGQAGSVPGMSVFSSGISLSGLENFFIWTLQSGYHSIWTAMIQLLAKSMPKLWETLCFAIFALFFRITRQNSSPFRISETGLKFSLKDPRRNWSCNRARMVNWSHLKRLLVLLEPSIGLLLYRLEVKRGCSSHKARWGICLVCMIVWPRRIWFMAVRRFPCHTKFYGMAGDPPKICPTPICSLSLATVLRLNYRVPVNGLGSTK